MFLKSLQYPVDMDTALLWGWGVDEYVIQREYYKPLQHVVMFMKSWKTTGTLYNLKGITVYSKWPYQVPKAVVH